MAPAIRDRWAAERETEEGWSGRNLERGEDIEGMWILPPREEDASLISASGTYVPRVQPVWKDDGSWNPVV